MIDVRCLRAWLLACAIVLSAAAGEPTLAINGWTNAPGVLEGTINPRPVDATVPTPPLGYVDYLPRNYDPANATVRWPLVIYLAGVGEAGNGTNTAGNSFQLYANMTKHGPLYQARQFNWDFPAVIIAPQSPNTWGSVAAIKRVVDYALANYRVDPDRVSMTGLCDGGSGTVRFAATYPDYFAALLPIEVSFAPTASQSAILRNIPMWTAHCFADPSISRFNGIAWVDGTTGADIGATSDCMATYPGWNGSRSRFAADADANGLPLDPNGPTYAINNCTVTNGSATVTFPTNVGSNMAPMWSGSLARPFAVAHIAGTAYPAASSSITALTLLTPYTGPSGRQTVTMQLPVGYTTTAYHDRSLNRWTWLRDQPWDATRSAKHIFTMFWQQDHGAGWRATWGNGPCWDWMLSQVRSNAPTPPVITSQPSPVTIVAGQTATFTIIAAGSTPRTFQWMRGGVAISGATSGTYTTPAATAADHGAVFTCRVANAHGTAVSTSGVLSITAPAVALNEFNDYQVFQRTIGGTSRTLTFSGTCNAAPRFVQVRVLDFASGAEVVPWTTIATSPGSAFSGTLSVPQGGWYRSEVRSTTAAMAVIASSTASRRWGVGVNVLCIGQSNMYGYGSTTYTAADDRVALLRAGSATWERMSDPWFANGKASPGPELGNTLVAALGVPVGLVPSANLGSAMVGSTGTAWSYRNHANRSDPSTLYGAALGRANAAGGVEFIALSQGASDAAQAAPPTTEAYVAATLQLKGFFAEDLANGSQVRWVFSQVGRKVDGANFDLGYDRIREAHRLLDNGSDMLLAGTTIDFVIADAVSHYDQAGQDAHGRRLARAILRQLGVRSAYGGPRVASLRFADAARSVVRATIEHRGGSDLTPTTAIPGFAVADAGGGKSVSASRIAADTVDIVCATPCVGATTVTYLAGKKPAGPLGLLRDDQADAEPVLPITVPTAVAEPVLPLIVTQPADVAVLAGATATFAVSGSSPRPLSYQWRRNGVAIAGATASDFTLTASAIDAGASFDVVVADAWGFAISTAAVLTVQSAPAITGQPQSASVIAGQPASFTVAAAGSAPMTIQWLRNGSPIAGATGATYALAESAAGDDGAIFAAQVANPFGSATSDGAVLTVTPAAITLNDFDDHQVVQRIIGGSSQVITVAGSCSPGTAAIQARIVNAASGATVVDWTTVVGAVGGPTYSGTLSVPQGGWYHLDVRGLAASQAVLASTTGSASWGVGVNVLCIGQSNMYGYGSTTYTAADDRVGLLRMGGNAWQAMSDPWCPNGKASPGPELGNTLVAALGVPVGLIPSCNLGSAMVGSSGAAWAFRNDANRTDPTTLYGAALARAQLAGGVEFIALSQGATDAAAAVPPSAAAYVAAANQLKAFFAEDLPNGSQVRWVFSQVGRKVDGGVMDAGYNAIREAHRLLDNGSDMLLSGATIDAVIADGISHYDQAGQDAHGRRLANAILHQLGLRSTYGGPRIAELRFADAARSVIRVTIEHRGGSDIAPASAIPGFAVSDDGGAKTLSAARVAADTVDITCTSPCVGATTVTYLAGKKPAGPLGLLSDNQAHPEPLLPLTVPTAVAAPIVPLITGQPASLTLSEGASATFAVSATSPRPLSYQWRRNGIAIAGATDASLTVSANLADAGASFTVVVADSLGFAVSDIATLSITALPPSILAQPAAQSAYENTSALFSVIATSSLPLSYQWRRNGVDIPGATSAGYTTASLTLADSGAAFSVLVSSSAGSVVSASALLSVLPSLEPILDINGWSNLPGVREGSLTAKPVDATLPRPALGYVEYLPLGYDPSDTLARWPLILVLGSSAEAGDGTNSAANGNQLFSKLVRQGPLHQVASLQWDFPAVIIAPQAAVNWNSLTPLKNMLDYAKANYRIDDARVYLTGHVDGGGAAIRFAAAYPSLITGILPIDANLQATASQATALVPVAMWAAHAFANPGFNSRFCSITWTDATAAADGGVASDAMATYPGYGSNRNHYAVDADPGTGLPLDSNGPLHAIANATLTAGSRTIAFPSNVGSSLFTMWSGSAAQPYARVWIAGAASPAVASSSSATGLVMVSAWSGTTGPRNISIQTPVGYSATAYRTASGSWTWQRGLTWNQAQPAKRLLTLHPLVDASQSWRQTWGSTTPWNWLLSQVRVVSGGG